MSDTPPPNVEAHRAAFQATFRRRAGAVHRARVLRAALSGASAALLASTLATSVSHLMFDVRARTLLEVGLLWLGAVLAGATLGAALGRLRRWSDEEVGLFLDARVSATDLVSAALAPAQSTRLLDTVYQRATDALSQGPSPRPRILARHHGVGLIATLVFVPLLLLRPAGSGPATRPPGSDPVTMHTLDGLEALEALGQLEAIDPDKQRALEALASSARELRKELATGVERRAAQASIAKLRDGVDALLGEVANNENRAGLAAAVDALSQEQHTRRAAEALGNADLVRFDEEMKKLAAAAEEDARQGAREALERAIQAARQKGARALSSALGEQAELFDRREHTARLLRELGNTLPKELGDSLEQGLRAELDPAAAERLADAMEKALASLTEAERQTLAEELRKAKESGAFDGAAADLAELERLAQQLEKGTGDEALREMLQKLAQPGAHAQLADGLRRAAEGLGRAQQGAAGALPMPQAAPHGGPGTSGQPGAQTGASGPGRGPQQGDHEGATPSVAGDDLRARAEPRLDPGLPLLHASQGRTAARPGEKAHTPEGSDHPRVAADDLRGIDHSSIPEEYREQVSRYFAP